MRFRKNQNRAPSRAPQSLLTCAAVLLTCLSAAGTMAQAPASDSTPSPAAGPPSPPPSQDAMEALGTWMQHGSRMMQQGVVDMGAGFGHVVGAIGGQAREATRDAADAARDAAASVSKLPNSSITAGHERCVVAPNGGPDCRVAAETLCRTKGYASGSSIDYVTIENCPPPYRASRHDAPAGMCTMEHYVTKALCQ